MLTNFGKTIENSIPRFGCMVFVAMNDKYFRFGVEFSYFYMYITFSLFIYFMVGTISLAAAIKWNMDGIYSSFDARVEDQWINVQTGNYDWVEVNSVVIVVKGCRESYFFINTNFSMILSSSLQYPIVYCSAILYTQLFSPNTEQNTS